MPTGRSPLFWLVYDKLVADGVDPRTADLVEAALLGDAELADRLKGAAAERPEIRDAQAARHPVRTWLLGLEVAGFRGIGKPVKLELSPGPGLTLIVGRNGSGKSSLAEALEVLLTGDNRRWAGRTKEWRAGWRNLHHDGPVEVKATFAVEDQPPVQLVRRWRGGDDLSGGDLEVRRGPQALGGVDQLGWKDALVSHRPMLSYADLGRLVDDGPSKLYDSLEAILGLEELSDAMQRLAEARLSRERVIKTLKAEAGALLDRLETVDDPRARQVAGALGSKWDLDAVDRVLAHPTTELAPALAAIRDLALPSSDVVAEALTAYREAVEAQARIAATIAGKQKAVADLVERALGIHAEHGDRPCPVCGTGSLDADWARTARDRLGALRRDAKAAEDAAGNVERTLDRLRTLVRPPPQALADAATRGFGNEAQQAWEAFRSPPSKEPLALAAHLAATLPALRDAVAAMQAKIRESVDAVEARWRPFAAEITAWALRARQASSSGEALRAIKAAEAWLKTAEDAIRRERFDPIAKKAQEIWAALRQESHVELAGVSLVGTRTSRRVDLSVTIDGAGSAALGVMSQGEVNALALSLFVPRLTHQDSPFRFLVIDDPVQAMDPFKVDGLARVLHDAARTHQVIVLTHDTRLQDAVKRMQIPARVLEVNRRPGSIVEVRRALAPVEQYLDDARAVALSPVVGNVAGRVVPALCRLAVEAELTDAVRKRRLARGDRAEDVEQALGEARTVIDLAALGLFDDGSRGIDVFPHLDKKYGRSTADLLRLLKTHVHEPYPHDAKALVDDTKGFVERLHRELA